MNCVLAEGRSQGSVTGVSERAFEAVTGWERIHAAQRACRGEGAGGRPREVGRGGPPPRFAC
jgi:hypothetical protein